MSIKFNAGMQEGDTKEGQLSAFQRTSWLFPRTFLFPFFPNLFFCSLNVTEKKKQPLNHSGRVCQQVVSSHKSSYARIRFSLCREIPAGSGSPSANANWKRDPPAGKNWSGRAALSRLQWRNLVNNWIQTGTLNIKRFLADTEGLGWTTARR